MVSVLHVWAAEVVAGRWLGKGFYDEIVFMAVTIKYGRYVPDLDSLFSSL